MQVIDDSGNLFGLVNVIDALVVLLLFAVVVAGATLVFGSGDQTPAPERDLATTNVTLDLGTQPDYIVDQLDEGDSYSPAGDSTLTITDIYRTPRGSDTHVLVQARLRGPTTDETINYDGAPPRLGRQLGIETDAYAVEGTIRNVGGGFERGTTQVLVTDTVSAETAVEIDEGDVSRVAGHEVATITSVTAYGTDDPDRKRVYLGLDLTTLQQGETPQFGTAPIHSGTGLSFRTGEYNISGTIQRVGTTERRGQAASRTVTLQLKNVSPALAQSITVGATETTAGTTVARITTIDRTSASVAVTSQDGNIYEREHPINRDVTFEANLSVRETATGTTFKGDTIQRGSTVTLDLGDVTVRAIVVSL